MMIDTIKKELSKKSSKSKAGILQRFFKTGKGEYGEGDLFLGVSVPETRKIAKKYQELPLEENQKLLKSPIHEERLLAILILIIKYEKAIHLGSEQKKIYRHYVKNISWVNNWDLIDISAPKIMGHYLYHTRQKKILHDFSNSKNIWKRRIAILTTFYFIRNNSFSDTLWLAQKYITDQEDLIHKATGWMLREIGKRDQRKEEIFLKKFYKKMPRTMLRYAIEKFDEKKRKMYLQNLI